MAVAIPRGDVCSRRSRAVDDVLGRRGFTASAQADGRPRPPREPDTLEPVGAGVCHFEQEAVHRSRPTTARTGPRSSVRCADHSSPTDDVNGHALTCPYLLDGPSSPVRMPSSGCASSRPVRITMYVSPFLGGRVHERVANVCSRPFTMA